jgi:hypothetical protein
MNRLHELTFFTLPALMAALCVSVTAQAAVIMTSTLVRNPPGTPFTSPDTGLGSPWRGYTLGLETTAGELIGGINVLVTGQLHQRWTPGEDDDGNPTLLPTANSANATNGDSHLRAVAGGLFAWGPLEDNSLAGSPLANTATAAYGIGTYLRGAWGIPNAQTTANVAYIVVPAGSEPTTNVIMEVANPMGDIIGRICNGGSCDDGPRLQVSGNGRSISDGDSTPSLLDHTDFGTVQPGEIVERTFLITNTGFETLRFEPPVLTGPYSLPHGFRNMITPLQSAKFTVAFDSTAGFGAQPGSISFAHNGGNWGTPFNFSLTAEVIPEPTSLGLVVLAVSCRNLARWRKLA